MQGCLLCLLFSSVSFPLSPLGAVHCRSVSETERRRWRQTSVTGSERRRSWRRSDRSC